MAQRTRPARSRGSDSRLAGIDLGGTKIQAVVLERGRVVASARLATPREGASAVIEAMAASVASALEKAGGGRLAAVGVGSPGKIDAAAGTVSEARNVPGLEDQIDLGPRLSRALSSTPVVLDNDVRAAVLGEHRMGAGRPYGSLLGVWLGTGVGGGVIIDNRLLEGRGAAGEIGHMVVRDRGWRCSCGRRGCLEAYAGRGCMERRAQRWLKKGRKTILFEVMRARGRDRLTSAVIARALKRGDPVTEKLVDRARWALGLALASAQNLLNTEAIVLGGGLGDRLGPQFAASVAAAMRPHLFVPEQAPPVLTTELGDLAGAVGAALRAADAIGGSGWSAAGGGPPIPPADLTTP